MMNCFLANHQAQFGARGNEGWDEEVGILALVEWWFTKFWVHAHSELYILMHYV